MGRALVTQSTAWIDHIHVGDCRVLMRRMIADGVRVQCIVTSPPYWGMRDYFVAGQMGSERTWLRHVARMRSVFRLCRKLLTEDGVLWVNYGDSYASSGGTGAQGKHGQRHSRTHTQRALHHAGGRDGLKTKDLIGMPWRIAFALQADGWYLRQDIIWSKVNPMPESVRDRCTKAHEYLFLFSKRERYYWDFEAMQEPANGVTPHDVTGSGYSVPRQTPQPGNRAHARRAQGHLPGNKTHKGTDAYRAGDETHRTKAGLVDYATRQRKLAESGSGIKSNVSMDEALSEMRMTRNKRSVWNVASQPFREAHFATFPPALITPCILAGSKPGDIIFDPFMGSGTTAQVALEHGRHFIGTELNPQYAAMFKAVRSQQIGMGL